MLKVLCVCVNGMGSSLILRMSVEKAMKALGIEATVDHCDLGGFGSRKPDIVVTTPALKGSLPSREGMRVVSVTNFVDVEGIKKAILEQGMQAQ
ncbi:MAG: PTS sugar transporter subunit IIB [Clostridiales bacterium]|nr:PTS sugar transporter subunit IIB [Clostridiales bacterium]